MSETCQRCGRSDGTHIGYHKDHELPIKRGQRVRVRSGAVLSTTLPDPTKRSVVNKRSRVVTALCVHWRDQEEPQVVWPGTGGYWHHANMSDCEVVP